MNKLFVAVVAATLGTASAGVLADDGNFFVNGDLGQANYRVRSSYDVSYIGGGGYSASIDKKDTAGALRFGYRWHSFVDYGVEIGYADLGETETTGRFDGAASAIHESLKVRGALLGGNLKYNINDSWYVSARGGWFRSKNETYTNDYVCSFITGAACPNPHNSSTGTGEYLGAGMGYNFNSHFSLGLSYDNYHSHVNRSNGRDSTNIALYAVSAEYRF